MEFWTYTTLIVLVLSSVQTMASQLESKSSTKLVWKVRPQAVQVAKEHDNVKLNCEFEYEYVNGSRGRSSEAEKYFVIWYKDGASQNVLSLNDQLAHVNSTSYEISGTYNLIIKNLTRAHSGVYTCQLFQSIDLVASVNLTVLVAPKYAKVTLNPEVEVRKEYLVENEVAYLECCTNADANPTPIFEWHRVARANLSAETDRVSPHVNPTHVHHHSSSLIKSNQELVRRTTNGREELCNRLRSNLTRFDNLYSYRCLISNEALVNRKPIEDSLMLTVEYKPEVLVHLASNPSITKSIRLITNSSLELYCNASARPNVINYQWYFEDSLLKEHRTNTLSLNNLSRGNSGRYECRCSNRHGTASSEFRVDILYAEIKAVNRTAYIDQKNVLKEQRAVFVSSYENSSLTLTCQVESNPTNDNVMWYYYELSADGHMRNQVVLSSSSTASTWTSSHRSGDDSHSDTAASFYSHLLLSNLTSNHSGYYSCAISSFLVDSLNRTQALHVNSTYFLLVQYAPIVRGVKRVVYANNYDQVELSCEVKSNPQSIFSWYFGPKELFSSYKYNLSSVIYKQMHRTFLDDMENYHHYRSKLVINSLTQFDFGEYFCRANNIIGESVQIIKLKRKQKPETPIDLKAMEVTANSVQLSWLSGPNGAGGENTTYVITINNLVNVTSVVDHFARSDDSEEEENDDDEDIESRFNMIEIRGLHANQEYELKIMASNSLGSSEFSSPIRVLTHKSPLRVERLPTLSNAQFNEQRESICFDLDKPFSSSQIDYKSDHSTTAAINDLLVRVEIDLDEALLANKTAESEEFRKISGSSRKTTYLVNLNRMKYGQNCVPYTQLIDADSQQRNESSSSLALASSSQHKRRHQSSPFNVVTLDSTAMMNSADALRLDNNNAPIAREAKFSNVDTFGYDFHDFIRLHRVNVSLCYANDSSICSQKIGVSDYNPDLSAYLTLVAIGCSAVLIIFILLIASICCCCCRRDTNVSGGKRKQKGVGLKNDLNSKLVIKSFPIVTSQKDYDYSDESTKSSQQHILNTSQTGSGNGNHSSGSSSFNEKTYYHHAPHQGGMTQDVTLFAYTSSQSSAAAAAAHHHLHHHHHISSIATVESDASSSTSLENKTTSTSQGGNTSSQAHSPYTLTEPTTSNVASTFISSFQQQQHQQHKLQPNNIYIKTYRQQQQGYNQQQFDHIDSSSYSTTPVNSTTNKKLVYEVIV